MGATVEKAFVVFCCGLFLALCLGSIRTQSVTNNEVLFIPAGFTYLQRHDARLDIEEPPLVKMVVALPALLLRPRIDYTDAAWTATPGAYEPEYRFGRKFFETWNPRAERLVFLTRLLSTLLSLLLGWSLYKVARRLAGPWGAALVLLLFATSPFFISYGSLVLMDLPIALFALWTMWYFASFWKDPSPRNGLLLTASLAGALITKFSAVFLLPAMFLAWIAFRYLERHSSGDASRPPRRCGFHREGWTVATVILAGLFVYFFYLGAFYRSDPAAILQNEWNSLATAGMRTLPIDSVARRLADHPGLKTVLLPPSLYLGGLSYVLGHEKRPVYFLGRWHSQGVWFYFPVISFFKLAPGMVVLFILLAAMGFWNFAGNREKTVSIVSESNRYYVVSLLAALIVFAAIAMSSKLNVGVRHFSVPITFGVALLGFLVPLAASLASRPMRSLARVVIGVCACSCLLTAILSYPHYLSYYNFFRLKTPKQEIAVTSNLSWGQSMMELDSFFREHHVADPYVDSRMSPVAPAVYVSGVHDWSCDRPDSAPPEWVAVSTVSIVRQPPNCDALLRYPSWDIGEGAVMVFHVTGANSGAKSQQ